MANIALTPAMVNAIKSGTPIQQILEQHGENINAREAAGLAKLSPADLKSLVELHEKVQKLSGWNEHAAWACGVLC
jgi:hypothetical protein